MVSDHLIQDSVKPSQSSNDEEVLVKADHVSKKFCRSLKKALWYGVQDIGSEMVGRKYERQLRPDEFWAVNDISFEVKRGECLGLIGPNGAGKSTLLRMLNGLIKPDKGSIMMRGRVSALIELMAGFNPILTGLENIYNRAAILGLSKADVNRKLDDIVEFAEIGDFLYMPVQNYSSGMKVRLGFAVAAQMEPDVLILDEVLAVGDVGFRAKCFNQIHQMMQKSAVIFVSHSIPQISRVCTDLMVMDHGKSVFQGKEVARGIDHYYSYFQGEEGIVAGSGGAEVHWFQLSTQDKKDIEAVNYLDQLFVDMEVTVDPEIVNFSVSITILSRELQPIAEYNSFLQGETIENSGERIPLNIDLGKVVLSPGVYPLTIVIRAYGFGEFLIRYNNFRKIKVFGDYYSNFPLSIPGFLRVVS